MDSKLTISGRALHPMLVGFPVALYLATFTAFSLHATGGSPFWWRVGLWANLLGVGAAVVAAIPGLVDLLMIPSGHPAKRVGISHMLLAVTALSLFVANLFVQRGTWENLSPLLRTNLGVPDYVQPAVRASLVLTGTGVAVTLAAGFLGWTLVRKHHVGIPHERRLTVSPGAAARVPPPRVVDSH